MCGFSCCRPVFHFFQVFRKFLKIFDFFRGKGKDVKLFFQVWPKMENWQFFATVKNHLCARKFSRNFSLFVKFLKNFAQKQGYSLEIEAIFAKMAKMTILRISRARKCARKGDFQVFKNLKILKIFEF